MPIQTPIVLIAPNGMLGRAWRERLDACDLPYQAVGRPTLDLRDASTLAKAIPDDAGTVINCAAWTDVDGAEIHETEATQINGEGVGALAQHCRQIGAVLVHYSTDYVFDGQASTPYVTRHPRAPLNAYGRSKARGEELLEAAGGEFLCLRTSWLYAPWGKNFVLTMARLTREKPELKVVNDQRGRPTSCEHLARTTLALLQRSARGFEHVTDGGECTWFDFTVEIARLVGGTAVIHPCATAEFPRPASRPAYSVLDLSRTEARVGPMPSWTENVADVLARV